MQPWEHLAFECMWCSRSGPHSQETEHKMHGCGKNQTKMWFKKKSSVLVSEPFIFICFYAAVSKINNFFFPNKLKFCRPLIHNMDKSLRVHVKPNEKWSVWFFQESWYFTWTVKIFQQAAVRTFQCRPTVTALAWERVMALNIIYAHLTTI